MIRGLPYDAELEYLESTGTQWIDTGIPLKFPISADMTLAMVSPYGTLDALPVFGFRYGGGSASSKFAIWFSKSQLRFALNYGSYDSSWKGSSVQSGQVVHLRTDGAKLYIDGSLVADGGTVTTSDASNTLTLFQMRDNSSIAARGQCVRYYSCKIYDSNGVLVLDLTPVRVGSGASAVGYMYDRVSGKLFGNAGSGAFVLGPDKAVPILSLHRYASPSNGVALGKMGVGATMLKQGKTARDYNYDLALWDAIENAGYGVHDASATSITNLLGGGLDISLFDNYTVNANNIRFEGGYGIADKYDFTGVTGATISVLASYDSTSALNAQGWSYAGAWVGRLGAYYDSTEGWRLPVPFLGNPSPIHSPISVGTITKTDFVWDASSQITLLFVDGIFVGSLQTASFTIGEMANHFRMMAYGSASDTNYATYKGNIYNCAVSLRALTAEEIARNYAIDKERFNLP